jgi:hypothetical protein
VVLSIGLSEFGCATHLNGARRRCLDPNISPGDEMSTAAQLIEIKSADQSVCWSAARRHGIFIILC